MSFTKYIFPTRARGHAVHLNTQAMLTLTVATTRDFKLAEYPFVCLWFDPETRRIALEFVKDHVPGALRTFVRRGVLMTSAKGFANKYGLKSGSYLPVWDESRGMLVCSPAQEQPTC